MRTLHRVIIGLSLIASISLARAQGSIPSAEYAARRAAARVRMSAHSVAVFHSAQNYPRTNSSNYLFRQSNSLLYLSGCMEENVTLALFSAPVIINSAPVQALLFVPQRSPAFELWNGPRMGPVEAASALGIATLPNDSLNSVLTRVLAVADTLYYDWMTSGIDDAIPVQHKFIGREQEKELERVCTSIKNILPTHLLVDSLRMLKSAAELALMQRAIDLSCAGHRAAMHGAHVGMYEYELAAEFDHVIEAGGAEGLAYPDIVGSGPNACYLHYETNRRRIGPHELVLMDCGAEYHGYAADITRTFPVDGTFTKEQRTIYELVLKAQEAGIGEVRAGVVYNVPHKKAMEVIGKGLVELGIISSDTLVRKYFPHGSSHTLGLDVHDTRASQELLAGMVITIEPGIYIPGDSPCDPKWWNIGVRIEDDVLVMEGGNRVMSACVPKSIEEIESAHK